MSTQTAPNLTGSDEAQAHIAQNAAVQQAAATAAATAWLALGNYDEADVPRFLARVVPLILSAQRTAVAITTAYLSRAIGRRVAPVDVNQLIGAAIRTATPAVIAASQRGGLALAPDATGVPPEIVYRRPFVGVWKALGEGTPWADAVVDGRERVMGTAAMDVQNTMRHTLRLVGEADDLILGYARVPDADACPFCKLIAGRRYLTSDLMEVHPRCRCGVEVITAASRDQFFGRRENDLARTTSRDGVSTKVVEHGELGALLVNGDDSFAGIEAIAA